MLITYDNNGNYVNFVNNIYVNFVDNYIII